MVENLRSKFSMEPLRTPGVISVCSSQLIEPAMYLLSWNFPPSLIFCLKEHLKRSSPWRELHLVQLQSKDENGEWKNYKWPTKRWWPLQYLRSERDRIKWNQFWNTAPISPPKKYTSCICCQEVHRCDAIFCNTLWVWVLPDSWLPMKWRWSWVSPSWVLTLCLPRRTTIYHLPHHTRKCQTCDTLYMNLLPTHNAK